ncbi:hypothetical protein jhhlp_001275 [Lomentospora prolificans]|uniref:Ubiquitin carboxyl-terminal hydrolase n=1 Tax=Lomentospora prolificans TaxID=41688 RepID=A0A2N3NHN4_9PEZI|nr:hypothetical protein jhhlp_001275 [Lomentospora prolificans]
MSPNPSRNIPSAKNYKKHFIPLESNPDVFNQLIRLLGAPESLVFEDVFTLDEPEFLPHPAVALVLIFPAGEGYEARLAMEEAARHDNIPGDSGKEVTWFKQTIHNACGLYAILHALSNGESRALIEPDSILSSILERCQGLEPQEQAAVLEDSQELEAAYNQVAAQGDTAAPDNPEDEVYFHYVCFTRSNVNDRLYELDGDRKGPIDRGAVLRPNDDVLSEGGLAVIREYIEREHGNTGFGLMALPEMSAPHRSVTNIRGGQGPGSTVTPSSPHTPPRAAPSAFGSPSTLRAEEDLLVIEIGSRFLRVGFAGDTTPRVQLQLPPEQQRRVGDYRLWTASSEEDWTKRERGSHWGEDYELWRYDVRSIDLGLVEDKLHRLLRDAFSKYLLIDSKPRRIALVLPSSLPLPLLSTTLDLLFNHFHAPIISLLSSATMSTVAAGVRSALIVDLGWAETVVTAVYEYREVSCTRSVRGGKHLVSSLHKVLKDALREQGTAVRETDDNEAEERHILSFGECEDICTRVVWCRPSNKTAQSQPREGEGLPTVQEQDELEHEAPSAARETKTVTIPLQTTRPPTSLRIQFSRLADACENTYFEDRPGAPYSFDDEELPAHWLIYQHLLHLPLDVRATCMSRIVFTGGCSKILGLKGRIYDEVVELARAREWDPVTGRGVEAVRKNLKLRRHGSKLTSGGPTGVLGQDEGDEDGVWHDAANAGPETNAIDEKLDRRKAQAVHGELRAVESLGPWSGASLTCQLKVLAVANVEREAWQLHGVNGASRPADVDVKTQQRQSLGAGGLMRGAAGGQDRAWTLGPWGTL